jgi:hypothetical protein
MWPATSSGVNLKLVSRLAEPVVSRFMESFARFVAKATSRKHIRDAAIEVSDVAGTVVSVNRLFVAFAG